MTGSTTRVSSKGQRLTLTLLLAAIAPLLNLTHIPLLFDVYLIFGSIATMTAVMLLGTPAAVLVAVSGSLVTLFLWGHPYALLIFSLEALCVGLCHRYWNLNVVLADMLYWVVAGIPLVGIFYYFGLDNSSTTTALIALKQPLNGVLNALLAVILVLALEALARSGTLRSLRSLRSSRFEFSEVLFISLLLGIVLAGTVPIAVEGSRDQAVHERFIEKQLQEHTRIATSLLGQEPEPSRTQQARHLATAQTTPDFGIALLDANGQVVTSVGTIRTHSGEDGDVADRVNGLGLWRPLNESHDLKRWQQGSYLVSNSVQHLPGIAEILVEYPAAPVVEELRTNQLQLLAILFAIIMLGVPAAHLLSLLLTRPLAKLTRSSHGLTRQITSGELPELPDSMLSEYSKLSDTLSEVTRALTSAFRELNRSQDTLRQTVAEKTAELSHANSLLNSVLDSATEISIIATDTHGVISVFNHGAERMLGYHADELVGKCTPLAFHDVKEVNTRAQELSQQLGKSIEGFEALTGTTANGCAEIGNWTYIHKSGQQIPVSVMVTAIRDGNNKLSGYLGIALDISERQRMDTLKDEFISTVSHELRTPLTSISGALALVRNGTLGDVPDAMRQMLNIAESNAKRLILLVNDLLDIQKITSGHLHFQVETCALPPLLDEAVEQNQPYGRKRGVTVKLMGPIPNIDVSVDRVRLIQALSNLLSNAIKFSPDHCPVEVRAEQVGDELTLSVIDQGAGIPDHFHNRIFQKFAQADSSDARQKGGTGLGLAITRELVEQMGGRVTFETSPTAGTRFHIRLPLDTGASGTTAIPAPTEPATRQVLAPATIDMPPTRPLVLHVEDDADLIDVMKVAAGNRFEVHFATSLAAAREQLQHPRRYQLVLLDIGLPDGSGWQLLPEIYRQQPQANVVILSGQHLSRQELDLVEATFTKSQASIDMLLSTLETLTTDSRNR